MLKLMKVNELIPHPENNYYFDDMIGDKWTDFLESIKDRGVIEPIIITDENVIVSGHQRVRACKEVGVEEIMCDIRHYDSQSAVIRDLLETNIMQRGEIISGYIKKSRILITMREFYDVKNGGSRGNQYTKNKTDEVAEGRIYPLADKYNEVKEKLNLSDNDAKLLMRFSKLLPEIQEAIDEEKLPFYVSVNLLHKLSADEQQQLLDMLPDRKVTGKEVQSYVDEIKRKDEQIAELEAAKEAAEKDAESYREEAVEALRNAKNSEDNKAYIKMKDDKEAAEQAYRDEYERGRKLSEQVREKQKALDDLQRKLDEVNKRPAKVETVVETVEVAPSDYDELREKAKFYDEHFAKLTQSETIEDGRSAEERKRAFAGKMVNCLSGFLTDVRSINVDSELLNMSDEDKDYFAMIAMEINVEMNRLKNNLTVMEVA